jgi:hypothetical protein
MSDKDNILNALWFERPDLPFHTWLHFRRRDWPCSMAVEIGFTLAACPDGEPGALVCGLMGGFFACQKHTFGLDPEDFEVWLVLRSRKEFFRLKRFGDDVPDTEVKFSVPGWGDVPEAWPERERDIFGRADGSDVRVAGRVIEGEDADRVEALWAEWTGGTVALMPDD